jgi:Ca2+-binding EF-hand superfamily protein
MKLETRLEELGLAQLDLDHDGVLSGEELQVAIKSVLKNYSSDEDADWLVNQIDQDHDGKKRKRERKESVRRA